MYKVIMMLMTLFLLSSSLVNAQNVVRGTVTDSGGEPLIGVAVLVKGTSAAAVTDINGSFSISARPSDILEFRYLGFEDLNKEVGDDSVLKVVMIPSDIFLDEVVVVGYGTQKKVNLTGSVASVGDEVMKDRGTVPNAISNLQGAMPGVVVTRGTPAVGREGWEIKIRGEASVNSVAALVLIDGAPGELDDINPADIENISVLKDASAAIYGARAAGGVILVTTKKGKEGRPVVTYKGAVEIKIPDPQIEWLNMSQYAYIFEEGVINDTGLSSFQGSVDQYGNVLDGINTGSIYKSTLSYGLIQELKKGNAGRYAGTVQPYNFGPGEIGFFDYDLNDVLWHNAVSHSHSLSLNGGGKHNKYNVSIGFMQDNSMLAIYDEYSRRYNFRINDTFNLSDRITINANVSFDRRETDYALYNATSVSGMPVGSPLQTPQGHLYSWGSQTSNYGMTKDGGSVFTSTNRFALNIQPTIRITDALEIVGRVSFSLSDAERTEEQNKIIWYNYNDEPSNSGAVIDPKTDAVLKMSSTSIREEYQGYLNYKKTIASSHNVAAMIGLSYENYRGSNFSVEGDPLSTGAIHSLNMAEMFTGEDNVNEYAIASYFARMNYDFKSRYLIEILGRYDGSSRFARGHRWAPFFGISGAWRISEERWMKQNGIFDNLKLRLSYGETGNQAGIGAYDYYAVIDQIPSSPSSPLIGGEYAEYIKYGNMVSLDRSWERVCTSNIGLDIAVLDSRLGVTLDLYQRMNNDMLVRVTYPAVLGASAPATNSGRLRVRGWELSLTWKDNIGDFAWWIGGNVSDSRNILLKMDGEQTKTWNGITSTLEGYPLDSIWGLRALKLIESESELEAYRKTVGNVYSAAMTELKVGDVMYKDTDGDGYITKDDVELLGDTAPHYSFALNFGFGFKGFDFSCILQGVGHQDVIRSINSTNVLGYSWYQTSSSRYFSNHWTTVREVCEAAGDYRSTLSVNRDPHAAPRIAYLAGKNYNYLVSDAWWSLQDASYLRLKNLVIGYTIPQKLTKKIFIDKIRVYVAGNDLLTLSSMKDGSDPENTSYRGATSTSYDNYPFARSVIFGLDIVF